MTLDDIATISGKGGLFKVFKPAKSGVIFESLDEAKTKIVATANNRLSILSEISIYTTTKEGTVPLAEDPRNADDAEIAAVLAHEIGHIVFQQEYDSMIDGTPLKNALWDAYIKHRRAMEAEREAVSMYRCFLVRDQVGDRDVEQARGRDRQGEQRRIDLGRPPGLGDRDDPLYQADRIGGGHPQQLGEDRLRRRAQLKALRPDLEMVEMS